MRFIMVKCIPIADTYTHTPTYTDIFQYEYVKAHGYMMDTCAFDDAHT